MGDSAEKIAWQKYMKKSCKEGHTACFDSFIAGYRARALASKPARKDVCECGWSKNKEAVFQTAMNLPDFFREPGKKVNPYFVKVTKKKRPKTGKGA